jgi:hypothetical protein
MNVKSFLFFFCDSQMYFQAYYFTQNCVMLFYVKADRVIATYRRMRKEPLWRMLASDNGPIVIGLLQSHLYDSERSLLASILHERIGRDLETLRAQGEDLPQSAQAYIANWLAEGYLERRFPVGASEEEYE